MYWYTLYILVCITKRKFISQKTIKMFSKHGHMVRIISKYLCNRLVRKELICISKGSSTKIRSILVLPTIFQHHRSLFNCLLTFGHAFDKPVGKLKQLLCWKKSLSRHQAKCNYRVKFKIVHQYATPPK